MIQLTKPKGTLQGKCKDLNGGITNITIKVTIKMQQKTLLKKLRLLKLYFLFRFLDYSKIRIVAFPLPWQQPASFLFWRESPKVAEVGTETEQK